MNFPRFVTPKLKVFSAKELVKVFSQFGFAVHSQKGSHIKLRRTVEGAVQIVVIPNHKEIAVGTLKAVINQASRFISETELKKKFYK